MSRARKLSPLLLGLALALLLASPARSASSDAAYNNSRTLEFMNAERQARGIRSVARDPSLDSKAQAWAEKLAAEGRMYHSSSYAGMSLGYRSAAQNLAYHDDSMSASQAHNMWMASGVHRKNMLDPAFSHVGIAFACSKASGRAYVMAVVEFGGDANPSSSTPPRNPQVAGGSGNARAISCDAGSPQAAAAPSTTQPAPTSTTRPTTTTTRPATTSSTVSKAASANVKASSTTTTRRPASTTSRPSTTTSAALSEAAGGIPSTSAPAPTSAPAVPPDRLASAASEQEESRSGLWVAGLSAIAGALLFAQTRSTRRTRHLPKHSMRRSAEQ